MVSGRKTASGMPILANDPHLEVNRLPNVWYEVVLKIAGRWAMGANMPGVPVLLIGRNPDLAWGATYTFMDATDSWIEKCKDGCHWRVPEGWVPFKKRTETIRRKKKTPVAVTFHENLHGVLEGDPHREGLYMAGGPSDRRFSKWYVADLENWAKGRYKRLKIGSGPRHRPFK